MMRWFGLEAFHTLCHSYPKVDTPTELRCTWCTHPIQLGDRGFVLLEVGCPNGCEKHAFHDACMMSMVLEEMKKRAQ